MNISARIQNAIALKIVVNA